MADLRSKTQDLMQTGFSKLGMSDANALKYAQDFAGRPDADTILASLGVLDLTPAGLVFGTQDAYRDFKKAETPTDYAIATGMLGLSGLEAFPATKGIAKYAKNLIKPKTGALPDNVDLSKRQTVKTLGALPVAAVVADPVVGALSKLGDAPVAKTVAKTTNNLIGNLKLGIIPDEKTFNVINDMVDEKLFEYENLLKKYGRDPDLEMQLNEMLEVKSELDFKGMKIDDNTFPAKILQDDLDEGARLIFDEKILKNESDLLTKFNSPNTPDAKPRLDDLNDGSDNTAFLRKMDKQGDPRILAMVNSGKMNSLPNLLEKLNAGFLPDAKTTRLTLDNVENKLLDMADDGMIDTPDYEDLEMISNDLKEAISVNEFPVQLRLHTTAEDIYKNKIIDDLADTYIRPPEGSGQGAFRMNQELLQEDYGIKLSDYEAVN